MCEAIDSFERIALGSLRMNTPSGARESGMRLYFHLRDKQHSLPDVEGVEVADVAQARTAALNMLQELRQENASVTRDWSGWTLDMADGAGVVLFSIDLDSPVR
jgi:hypothetical protein